MGRGLRGRWESGRWARSHKYDVHAYQSISSDHPGYPVRLDYCGAEHGKPTVEKNAICLI